MVADRPNGASANRTARFVLYSTVIDQVLLVLSDLNNNVYRDEVLRRAGFRVNVGTHAAQFNLFDTELLFICWKIVRPVLTEIGDGGEMKLG